MIIKMRRGKPIRVTEQTSVIIFHQEGYFVQQIVEKEKYEWTDCEMDFMILHVVPKCVPPDPFRMTLNANAKRIWFLLVNKISNLLHQKSHWILIAHD